MMTAGQMVGFSQPTLGSHSRVPTFQRPGTCSLAARVFVWATCNTLGQTQPNIPIIPTPSKLSSRAARKLDASLWLDGTKKIFPKIKLHH